MAAVLAGLIVAACFIALALWRRHERATRVLERYRRHTRG